MRKVATASPDPDAISRLSADPGYNALMRTSCVATRFDGEHAANALPQMARSTVNCRILPEDRPDDVLRTLVDVVANDKISVTLVREPVRSPPSPLDPA